MKVFVLHDLRRPDEEWELCRQELARQGIEEYEVVPAFMPAYVADTDVRWTTEHAINFSHKTIVALAKFRQLEEACILESDVVYPAVDGWDYFLKNKPAIFDLYLGGIYDHLGRFRKLRQTFGLQAPAYPVDRFSGFHCYIVHSRYYDRYLGLPDEDHIDGAQAGHGVHYCCYPFAAIQRPGWSAINKKKDTNYNYILKPEDVYGDASAYGVGQTDTP